MKQLSSPQSSRDEFSFMYSFMSTLVANRTNQMLKLNDTVTGQHCYCIYTSVKKDTDWINRKDEHVKMKWWSESQRDGEKARKLKAWVARENVCKLVMEDWSVETKDGLMKNTVGCTESACAICFLLPTKGTTGGNSIPTMATWLLSHHFVRLLPSLIWQSLSQLKKNHIKQAREKKKVREMKEHPVCETERSTEMRRETISQSGWMVLIQNGGSLLNIYTVIIHSKLCRCRIPTVPSWEQDKTEE